MPNTVKKVRKSAAPFYGAAAAWVVYALAFDWCFSPNGIAFGGVTGAAQIINYLIPALPIGVTVIGLNIPLFLLGWKFFGGGMLAASLFAMGLSSTLLDMMGKYLTFPVLSDTLLSALCGGERWQGRLLFSPGEKAALTLRLKKGENPLSLARTLVGDYVRLQGEPADADA